MHLGPAVKVVNSEKEELCVGKHPTNVTYQSTVRGIQEIVLETSSRKTVVHVVKERGTASMESAQL